MTIHTVRNAIPRKLPAVNISVTVLTLCRSRLEIDVGQPGFEVRRLVTVSARSGAMRSYQWERGLRMIEFR